MDVDRHLERLSALAKEEQVPEVQVAGQVMDTLKSSSLTANYVAEGPLVWVAGLASVAAVAVIVVAIMVHGAAVNPLTEVMETVSWVNIQ